MKTSNAWPVLAAVIAVAAACQPAGPVTTPASPTGSPVGTSTATQTTTPTAGATPLASAGESPTAQALESDVDFEIGPGTFFQDDPRAGLAALASYTQTLTVAFDGTVAGQPQAWSKVYTLQHSADPSVSVLNYSASGQAAQPDPVAIAEADGTAYRVAADGTCAGQSLDPEDSAITAGEPVARLPGLLGAEEAGPDSAGGVPASRYTFDGRALLEAGGPPTSGQVWIATDGGYVARFTRETTADAEYFGGGLDGKMTWDYELTDVNALASLAVPAGCQLAVPIMAGASNVLVLPRYAGFDTQSAIADVVTFYKDQLAALGWTVKSEPAPSDLTAVIEFGKDDQILNLLVTAVDGGRRVDLALTAGG
jgi:hypothetical protein